MLGDFVSREDGYARAAALFDEARAELAAGGAAFPFQLTSGFAGFNTPATFARVNRALKARMDVYRGRWDDALVSLGESFVSTASATPAALATGVYHVYSTASGDATNPLFDAGPRALVAVPSFLTEAQLRPDGTIDRRAASKAQVMPTALSTQGVSSNVRITAYASNVAPVPWIKNEELILLRAEAHAALGNRPAAIEDLNFVRVNSGGSRAPGRLRRRPGGRDPLQPALLALLRVRHVGDARRYGRSSSSEALPTHRIFPLVRSPSTSAASARRNRRGASTCSASDEEDDQ